MNHSEILRNLRNTNEQEVMAVFRHADTVRRANVGEAVHLSGSIEISAQMSGAEILTSARKAIAGGCTGIILHSRDSAIDPEAISDAIGGIKQKGNVEITLSLGERSETEVSSWKAAGADRYFLRLEEQAAKFLRRLREIGYQIGAGVKVGAPGQSFQGLARDIQTLEKLNPDLIAVSPYLPHEDAGQVPASADMVYRVIALCRRLYPRTHILLSTAIAVVNPVNGRELGLGRGGNMLMANATPRKYRKASAVEAAEASIDRIRELLRGIGRRIAIAPGLPSATRFL
jgi:biotin synthase